MSSSRKRTAVEKAQQQFEVSERRACTTIDQPRSTQRYTARVREDEPKLIKCILELVRKYPRYGYRFITAKLQQAGWAINAKRVYRIWRREGLKVPQKKRKKQRLGTSKNACMRRRSTKMNDVWSWDFTFDRTTSGSALKWFSIIDEYTRENLCLKVGRSITSEDVIDALAEIISKRGVPNHIRSDNGPEFVAKSIQKWLKKLEVQTMYIQPGSPWENGYAESFNSRFRDEFLATEEFENIRSARRMTRNWRTEYNESRPHSSLGYRTPKQFALEQRSAPAPQTRTASSPFTITAASSLVQAEAIAKTNEAQHNHRKTTKNRTQLTQPELS